MNGRNQKEEFWKGSPTLSKKTVFTTAPRSEPQSSQNGLKQIYDYLSANVGEKIIGFEDFRSSLQDSTNARKVHDYLGGLIKRDNPQNNIIEFEDFINLTKIEFTELVDIELSKPIATWEDTVEKAKKTRIEAITAAAIIPKEKIEPTEIIPEPEISKDVIPRVIPKPVTAEPLSLRTEIQPLVEPGIRAAEPKTLGQRVKEIVFKPFKETPAEATVRSQNIYAISKNYGLPIKTVREDYDDLAKTIGKTVFGREPTLIEMVEKGFMVPIVAGLVSNPLATAAGVTGFMAMSEVINLTSSVLQKEPYKFLAGRRLTDLLPEEVNRTTKEFLELLELAGQILVARGIYKRAPKLFDKFTKEVITEYKLPEKVYISPEKVADIWRTGKEISPQETSLYKELGLKGKQIRDAIKRGVDIEVPAEKIVTISDKPYYAKIKSLFRLEPYKEVKVFREGKPVGREPIAGLLREKALEGIKPEIKKEIPVEKKEVKPIKEKVAKVPEVKEPWEMTRADIFKKELENINPNVILSVQTEKGRMWYKVGDILKNKIKEKEIVSIDESDIGSKTRYYGKYKHIEQIEQALAKGKPVSPEVLKDYPDLVKAEVPAEKKVVKPELTQKQINMVTMLSKSYEKGNILFKDYNRLVADVKRGFIATEEQVKRNLEKLIKPEIKPKPFAKLGKYLKDIKIIRAGFEAGEPGYRKPLFTGKAVDLENLTLAERQKWIGEHSTYPFKGYEKKEVLNITGKALAGKKLTEKQTIYLEELIGKQRDSDLKRLLEQRWRKEVSEELKTEEELYKDIRIINEKELSPGDKFKIEGEDYEVAKRTKEGLFLVNDKKIELGKGGEIEIDKGSLAKAKPEVEPEKELKRPPREAEIEVPESKKPYPTTALFVTKDVKTGEKILKNEPVWYVPELKGMVKQKTFKKLFQQEQKTGKLFYEGEIEKFKVKKPKEELKGQEKLFREITEPSEFVPTEKEPIFIDKVVIDTFREFPKEIKKVGDDFWIEVMAIAKDISTPFRYKALRRTILGKFETERGIKLQDVRDALTATHEIGHNIDWLLNSKSFPSSIKRRFSETDVSEITLRSELKKVSQILRPDLWEDPKRKQYVNRHTELMADFISHYIFEPEKTLRIAPNITRLFELKLADKPNLFSAISRLQEKRYEEVEKSPIAEHILKTFPLSKKYDPLKLSIDLSDEGYVKTAENLGIKSARNYKALIYRAEIQAKRIDGLVPDKDRQTDLVVIAEKGERNPWTGETRAEILAKGISADERKAINLFRAYQELARQTVNKYLRGADIAEYIKFIEDYFIHAYVTPLTQKYKSAISRWAKKSPQAKKRILPDLDKAVEIGLKPRVKTLSDGLRLWSGINYRVATNIAFLKALPKIINDDGVSIIQKPKDFPEWDTVDYHPIRQTYKVPIGDRGILLFQGQVAVDPRVKPFIDAMFGRRFLSSPVRLIEGFNAIAKAFELTLFSLFHHQAEFFSACGAFGARAMPYLGGYWGKKAELFGKSKKLGIIPAHIKLLQAGKELENVPEFVDDYVKHGGQLGRITTEGINTMENMLIGIENYVKITVPPRKITTGGFPIWQPYTPFTATRATYSWTQRLLWDNVQRVKLLTYYKIVSDGCARMEYLQNKANKIRELNPSEAERIEKKIIPVKEIKEIAAKYTSDNYGGQEWLNTVYRDPKVRQFFTQGLMSLDWTWSQVKTGAKVFAYVGKTPEEKARMEFVRRVFRKHWFKWLISVGAFTIAGNYALSGKFPWDNEAGHKLDIDWTNVWRTLPWNSGLIFQSWKVRGDYSRRYIGLGKAGRELHRWIVNPLVAFGYKLSPGASMTFEQLTGYIPGSTYPEAWVREDLEGYEKVYERFKGLMDKFKPFAFSGNNAFLAFPSRKGMTQWKAIRSYEDIYNAKAKIAAGGMLEWVTKVTHILKKNEDKLRKDIIEACELNNIDYEESDRFAMSNIRSNFYRKFWQGARNLKINKCNRYALSLVELGVIPKGFIQSLRTREEQISEEALEVAVKAMERATGRPAEIYYGAERRVKNKLEENVRKELDELDVKIGAFSRKIYDTEMNDKQYLKFQDTAAGIMQSSITNIINQKIYNILSNKGKAELLGKEISKSKSTARRVMGKLMLISK